MSAYSTLVDVAAAPPRMVLERGVWFTHGADMALIANHVAPALVGETLRDVSVRRRRAAGYEYPGRSGERPQLVVVADGRHLTPGPAVPWVHLVPVHGRVQHAKFGVLVFRDLEGRRRQFRSFVSSANLTSGGLSTNLELLLVEDRPAGTTRSLAGDLLRALGEFVNASAAASGELRASDHAVLRALQRQLRTGAGSGLGLVVHSLDKRRDLLPSAIDPADQIDIVSPAFAAPTDSAVVSELLDKHLHRSSEGGMTTKVVWHLGAEPDGTVVVPKAAWKELRKSAAAELRVVGNPAEARRALHAKVLAFTRSKGRSTHVDVVAGSANFTSRGLGGHNRELVIRWSTSSRAFRLIKDLDSQPLDEQPRFTTRRAAPVSEAAQPLPVLSADHVEVDPELGVRGVIRVTDIPRGVTVEVRIGRRWRSVTELDQMLVPVGAALLTVRLTDRTGKVATSLVPLDCSSTRPDVWTLGSDRDIEPTTELDALLSVVRRAAQERRTVAAQSTDGSTGSANADDRYLQTLTQPLVQLARHRRELAKLESPELLEAALEQFDHDYPQEQWHPLVEARIARALLGLSAGSTTALIRAVKDLAP